MATAYAQPDGPPRRQIRQGAALRLHPHGQLGQHLERRADALLWHVRLRLQLYFPVVISQLIFTPLFLGFFIAMAKSGLGFVD